MLFLLPRSEELVAPFPFPYIQLCMHLGIFHLVIESDCQLVVKELQSAEVSYSHLGNLFQDIKALMASFQLCNI